MFIKKTTKSTSNFLKINAQTLFAFKKDKKILGKTLDLHYRKNNHNNARLGIITPKKLVPLAVSRNKLRRQIKEDFKKGIEQLNSYDILVVIKRKIETPKAELEGILTQEWKKLKKHLSK